jgi:hypothetical protein
VHQVSFITRIFRDARSTKYKKIFSKFWLACNIDSLQKRLILLYLFVLFCSSLSFVWRSSDLKCFELFTL